MLEARPFIDVFGGRFSQKKRPMSPTGKDGNVIIIGFPRIKHTETKPTAISVVEPAAFEQRAAADEIFPEPLDEEFCGDDGVIEIAAAPDEIFPDPLEDDDVEMVHPDEPDEIFPEAPLEDLDAPIITEALRPLTYPETVLPPTPPERVGPRPPVRHPGSGLLALNGGAPAPAKPNLGFLPPPPRERLLALSSPAPRPTGGYAKAPPAPTPVAPTTAPPPVQPASGLLSPRPLPPLPDVRERAASAPRPPRVSMNDATKLQARRPPLAPETPKRPSGTLTADDIPF